MPKIFISYRRKDSQEITGRIFDHLEGYFGRNSVFIDIDNIPLGVDFREHLGHAVTQCDVLLAIVGKTWLDSEKTESGKRRLDDPGDFVRIEVESALQRNIPVIPVLVGNASMPPAADLPESLRPLVFRNATDVGSGREFRDHVTRLIRGIEQLAKDDAQQRKQREAQLKKELAQKEKEERERKKLEEIAQREARAKQLWELARKEKEEKARREKEEAIRRRQEEEEERKREEEEERLRIETERREGQVRQLRQFVWDILERTRGVIGKDDLAKINQANREYGVPKDQATSLIKNVKALWAKRQTESTPTTARSYMWPLLLTSASLVGVTLLLSLVGRGGQSMSTDDSEPNSISTATPIKSGEYSSTSTRPRSPAYSPPMDSAKEKAEEKKPEVTASEAPPVKSYSKVAPAPKPLRTQPKLVRQLLKDVDRRVDDHREVLAKAAPLSQRHSIQKMQSVSWQNELPCPTRGVKNLSSRFPSA